MSDPLPDPQEVPDPPPDGFTIQDHSAVWPDDLPAASRVIWDTAYAKGLVGPLAGVGEHQ